MYPNVLSSLIFLPLSGALLVALLPARLGKGLIYGAIGVTGLMLVLTLGLFWELEAAAGVQLEERLSWIRLDLGALGKLAIDYHLGLDGLSIPMVLLSAIVLFVGAVASVEIKDRHKGYAALYLLLSATVMGCFLAIDFFLFFLCFEFMLLPMYFLIGLWGGARREYASLKFLIYTLAGSVMVLLVMIALYSSTASPGASGLALADFQRALQGGSLPAKQLVRTFDLMELADPANRIPGSWLSLSGEEQGFWTYRMVALVFLLVGFGIKLPVVPLHTWLPDAHVEAPTAISVVLAGVLLKVGGYGLMRIAAPIFPAELAAVAPWVGGVGVLSILYGAMLALGAANLKKMIACSSISHMGFVMLGLASHTAVGWSGAVYQMFSHGIISAMLFLVAGVIYHRTGSLEIGRIKGLTMVMPQYGVMVAVAFFAGLGLPGFSGFMAELLVFLGGFGSSLIPVWMPVLALVGLILTAAYFLWTYQRMYLGSFSTNLPMKASELADLNLREWLLLAALGVLALLFGIFPSLLLDLIAPFVQTLLSARL